MANGSLIKVESIAECSPWSLLQYFWPALSVNWSRKPVFCLFEGGRFTQVLLYSIKVDTCISNGKILVNTSTNVLRRDCKGMEGHC